MNPPLFFPRGIVLVSTILLALMCLPVFSFAGSSVVTVPMTIEYPLLNTLVAQSSFSGAGQETILLHEQDGCRDIVVSSPRFFEENNNLFLEIRLHVQHGLSLWNVCMFPVSFDGFLVLRQIPVVSPTDWSLQFETGSSLLLNLDRQPARLANLAWGMVQDHVFGHLEKIRVDLELPNRELRDFLPLILPRDQPDRVLEMLASLRPGTVSVQPRGLRLEKLIDVPQTLYRISLEDEAPLTEAELEQFIAAWETWDAFMVHMITALVGKDLNVDERLLLLDVLLRLRHGFLEELENPKLNEDLVRVQFVDAWEILGPIFRNHLITSDTSTLLGYLAFYSASDALVALDTLGPALGLDISRDGLLRLARLLAENKEPLLDYDPEVLPDLLRTFGIEDRSSQDFSPGFFPGPSPSFLWTPSLFGWLFAAPAWAETSAVLSFGQDRQWIFYRSDVHAYLARTENLLREQADMTLQGSKICQEHHELFKGMVLATAWQESCFRQFISTGEQVTFLRSYNNTSVGLMQINERVWRGIYDQHKLRWDIVYNARTGTKILDLYFTKYAQPRMRREQEKDWDPDTIAGLLYAMYSGGPGQLERFLQRRHKDNLYRSDSLFKEKWDWVRQDALDKASICLIGR